VAAGWAKWRRHGVEGDAGAGQDFFAERVAAVAAVAARKVRREIGRVMVGLGAVRVGLGHPIGMGGHLMTELWRVDGSATGVVQAIRSFYD
jgi:hypothetical protein